MDKETQNSREFFSHRLHCKHCGSIYTIKVGKTNDGKERYRCKDCHQYTTSPYVSKDYSNNYEDHGKSKISTRLVALVLIVFIGVAAFVFYDFNQSKSEKALDVNENNTLVATLNNNTNVVSPAMVYSTNTSNTTENTNVVSPAMVYSTNTSNNTIENANTINPR